MNISFRVFQLLYFCKFQHQLNFISGWPSLISPFIFYDCISTIFPYPKLYQVLCSQSLDLLKLTCKLEKYEIYTWNNQTLAKNSRKRPIKPPVSKIHPYFPGLLVNGLKIGITLVVTLHLSLPYLSLLHLCSIYNFFVVLIGLALSQSTRLPHQRNFSKDTCKDRQSEILVGGVYRGQFFTYARLQELE